MQPEFVVCDEPISALDVSVQAQVVRLLGELKESLGLTMLFIAHDLSMVRYISDRMAVMYLGALVEIGKADDVFFRPKHPYTADSDQIESGAGSPNRKTSALDRGRRGDRFTRQHRRGLQICRALSSGPGRLQNNHTGSARD
jgi:ABC-type oligopeptide transport system ATPase subunit